MKVVGGYIQNDWAESLSASLAADAGENAKLAEDQHLHVDGLFVAHQASIAIIPVGAGAVAFDMKYHVFFVFEAPRILDGDQVFPGIVMHSHRFRSASAPNPEISNRSLLDGKSLFLRHRIPLAALCEKGVLKSLPNHERARDGRCPIVLVLVSLLVFREFCSKVFLSCLPGGLIPHWPWPPGEVDYTISNNKPLMIWQGGWEKFNGVKQVYGRGVKMFPGKERVPGGGLAPEPKDDAR